MLSLAQSLCFTRGIYRVWLYWSIFSSRWTDNLEWMSDMHDNYDLEAASPVLKELLRDRQRAFLLNTISTLDEKREFCALAIFVLRLGDWLITTSRKMGFSSV